MTEKANTWKLNIDLIKEEYSELSQVDEILRQMVVEERSELLDEYDYEGIHLVGAPSEKTPTWHDRAEKMTKKKLTKQTNKSTRALMIIKSAGRLFAIYYGHGRHMLIDGSTVKGFGRRLTLNLVDHRRLKSVDTNRIEERSLKTKRQSSRPGGKEAFAIETDYDLLRTVGGYPLPLPLEIEREELDELLKEEGEQDRRELISSLYLYDEKAGKYSVNEDSELKKLEEAAEVLKEMGYEGLVDYVEGCDSVSVNKKLPESELGSFLAGLYEAYCSDRYKKRFDWVDNIVEIKDKMLVNNLNLLLLEDFNSRNSEKMHLAPPEVVDWREIEGVCYHYSEKGTLKGDLDIIDCWASKFSQKKVTFDRLKSQKLFVKYQSSPVFYKKWSILNCLVYETELDGKNYVLSAGSWYGVDKELSKVVKEYVSRIDDADITLPLCRHKEVEGDYNLKAAKEAGMILLDCKNIKCEGASSPIEPCDLLSAERQFIHVKKKHNSASLSHLISQGRISAEAFMGDIKFRRELRKKVKEQGGDESLISLDEVRREDYEIVFAIIDSSDKPLHESLPFFTLLNLKRTAEALINYGFKVSKYKITWDKEG